MLARAHLRRATNIELRMQRYVRGYREDRIGERPFPYPILGGGNVLKMVERAKRGVRSNRSLISHRFHAWCCQADVLVAIAIPVFTNQLEKSREATDLANFRSAYAECAAEILTADTATYTCAYKKVDPKQTTSGWVTSPLPNIGTATVPTTGIVSGTPYYVVVKDDGSSEITATAPTTKALNLDA